MLKRFAVHAGARPPEASLQTCQIKRQTWSRPSRHRPPWHPIAPDTSVNEHAPSPPASETPSGAPRPTPQIRVRGRSFMALVLSPEPPLSDWMAGLDAQIAKSAAFFASKPIILDCGLLTADDSGLAELVPALLERGIRLIEIEGADPAWEATAGWTWPDGYSGGRAIGAVEIPEEEPPPPPDPRKASLVIDEPVRSGQSINFADGDVVILGSVASGAEVSAGGSIHVYGTLRGRALAGVGGKPVGADPGAPDACRADRHRRFLYDCRRHAGGTPGRIGAGAPRWRVAGAVAARLM